MTKKKRKTRQRKLIAHGWVILAALTVFSWTYLAFTRLGFIGIQTDNLINLLFGESRVLFYVSVAVYCLYRAFFKKRVKFKKRYIFAYLFISILVYLWTSYLTVATSSTGLESLKEWINQAALLFTSALDMSAQGGLVGMSLYALSTWLMDRQGTFIFLCLGSLGSLLFFIDIRHIAKWFTHEVEEDDDHYQELPLAQSANFLEVDSLETVSPRKVKSSNDLEVKTKSAATIHTIGNYALPSISLLDEMPTKSKSNANSAAAHIKGKRLIEILGEFGVNASLVATHIGPAVTKFEVRPDSNVKISKIASLQDNIKMELSAKELRIEAPIPGRNAVGVEIPNVETTPVRLIEMMREIPNDKKDKKLLYPLGKDLMGKAVYAELDKMPHLLVAGATGSGKSVCINVMIVNFLLRTSPDEVKLLLIDPKKVEFSSFAKIPHLIAPVISDAAEAARALKIVVNMMENRYEVFSNVGVRNISAYNALIVKNTQEVLEPMPWIVVIIDELADLMVVAGKDVESSIQRITQLARAAGIHLVVATQRPSTDVITGIIKANIPSRIAFEVSNGIDSRTILDHVGAERLLGKGDMLFYPVGEPAPVRVQGAYISDEEVHRIADSAASKQKPNFDEAFLNLTDPETGTGLASQIDDPMYQEVKEYIMETGRASTSNIQRRFGLGYNRAARMIDMLEQEGIVGPAMGSKPRDVYKHN